MSTQETGRARGMKIIGLVNQKGGVAKSTTAINLAAALVQMGKKVCVIDCDAQAHLTYGLGIQAHTLQATLYELLKGEAELEDMLIERKGLLVVPSSLKLSAADMEFAGLPAREFLMKEALKNLKGVDYVFCDSGPSLGLVTLNVLTYVQEVFVPCLAEFLSLQGMRDLRKTIEVVQKRLNQGLALTGVIVCRYDGRKKLCKEVLGTLKKHFPKELFKAIIKENVSLAECPSHGQTIFEYRASSKGAECYKALAKELLAKERQAKHGKKG